ncbi:unnamed protein product [Dibothriocephalus latus]|uniref:Rab-GAP TBC domain-containing protein n=1 Tax=Dibothriocephalus latus TaxID=60516 RepID=A0A3P7LB66_DIBLA|nr:unnamed protein product [Dibothriocephalus latus]
MSHPGKGYCQGQAPLAAVLLMFMPEADAFGTFNKICDNYLEHYYDEGLACGLPFLRLAFQLVVCQQYEASVFDVVVVVVASLNLYLCAGLKRNDGPEASSALRVPQHDWFSHNRI